MEKNQKIEVVGDPDLSCVLMKPGYINYAKQVKKVFEREGLQIEKEGIVYYTRKAGAKHYVTHKGRHYYNGLIDYITSGPVYFMEVTGENARVIVDGLKKSIREVVLYDFPNLSDEQRKTRNVIHATDLVTDAQYEIDIALERLKARKTEENSLQN